MAARNFRSRQFTSHNTQRDEMGVAKFLSWAAIAGENVHGRRTVGDANGLRPLHPFAIPLYASFATLKLKEGGSENT